MLSTLKLQYEAQVEAFQQHSQVPQAAASTTAAPRVVAAAPDAAGAQTTTPKSVSRLVACGEICSGLAQEMVHLHHLLDTQSNDTGTVESRLLQMVVHNCSPQRDQANAAEDAVARITEELAQAVEGRDELKEFYEHIIEDARQVEADLREQLQGLSVAGSKFMDAVHGGKLKHVQLDMRRSPADTVESMGRLFEALRQNWKSLEEITVVHASTCMKQAGGKLVHQLLGIQVFPKLAKLGLQSPSHPAAVLLMMHNCCSVVDDAQLLQCC